MLLLLLLLTVSVWKGCINEYLQCLGIRGMVIRQAMPMEREVPGVAYGEERWGGGGGERGSCTQLCAGCPNCADVRKRKCTSKASSHVRALLEFVKGAQRPDCHTLSAHSVTRDTRRQPRNSGHIALHIEMNMCLIWMSRYLSILAK